MKYLVEHMTGTAGVDETATVSEEVEAADGFAAIHQLAGELDGWTIERTRPIVAVRNPDAANTSGRYCDYWMAVPLEFQWGELPEDLQTETDDEQED